MQWKHVAPGETLPFQFESRGKLRHLNTHDMKIHQIIVRAEGWQETTAVSVDRVGTYFREVFNNPFCFSICVLELKLDLNVQG